ncbi:stage II sporulation protein M [Mesorhizobium sp. M0185]|uniref:stage II sporulation protein M n=1 Tax=unclassified Mesorhizobium TaxID=325217 RepID=UPI003335D136
MTAPVRSNAVRGDAVRQSLASFRREREADWKAFEALLARVEKRAPRTLSEEELLSLPLLYRSALSSLSVARATSLDNALVGYLEALSLRGYFYLYGARRGLRQRLADFFLHDWPEAIRDLWRETLASVALMVIGIGAGAWLVASDKSWFDAIIPPGLAGGRGPDTSAELLRGMLYDGDNGFLSGFAAYLFTHNVQVAILAFALGFAFAVPTVLLMLFNGCMIGALFQVYWSKGLGMELGGWLAIHGTTELFAISLAGAAGMRIGTSIAFPGELTRMAAAARAGRIAANAMVGVSVMLLFAGLLEGIGRQTITSDITRYGIGGGMLVLWIGYFYLFRAVRHGDR